MSPIIYMNPETLPLLDLLFLQRRDLLKAETFLPSTAKVNYSAIGLLFKGIFLVYPCPEKLFLFMDDPLGVYQQLRGHFLCPELGQKQTFFDSLTLST